MFGSRKRKPKPEEEPLVPHGLIWHATAEPETPLREQPAPSKYAEIIVLTPRPEAQKSPGPTIPIAELLANQISQTTVPPPKVEPPSAALKPPSTPSMITAKHLMVPVQANNPMSGDSQGHPGPSLGRTREIFNRSVAWLQSSSTVTRNNALLALSRMRKSWSQASQSVDFKKEWLRARELAKAGTDSGIAVTRRSIRKTHIALLSAARLSVVPALFSMKSATLGYLVSAKRGISHLAPKQVRWSKIRISLFLLPVRARILLARKVSEWEIRRKQPLDHRLWSSMTLAAICAILALIVVSIVPRYASKSLPSRLFAVTPTVSASTMPTDKAASVSDTEKNPARTVAPITSVGHPDTSLTSGKLVDAAAHEKRRRAVDDDYVAPDTYKYYGNAPSEAHR